MIILPDSIGGQSQSQFVQTGGRPEGKLQPMEVRRIGRPGNADDTWILPNGAYLCEVEELDN
jgi:hypothetical protein